MKEASSDMALPPLAPPRAGESSRSDSEEKAEAGCFLLTVVGEVA